MDGPEKPRRGLLLAIACAAGPAALAGELVTAAQLRGWTVGVATPAALPFLDLPRLQELAGSPVRTEHRAQPGERWSSRDAAAVVVAPATYNTICKLANGIADNYALVAVAEAIGRGTPVAILPFVNSALASRSPFVRAVESLRAEGVRLLLGPGAWEPHSPGAGPEWFSVFPWAAALDAVSAENPGQGTG